MDILMLATELSKLIIQLINQVSHLPTLNQMKFSKKQRMIVIFQNITQTDKALF